MHKANKDRQILAQDLGMVLFLAISGSLFHNVAVDKVGRALPDVSPAEIGNLIAGSSSRAFQALTDAEKALVIPEISSAMTSIWAFFLAAAALSVVCSVPLLVSRDAPLVVAVYINTFGSKLSSAVARSQKRW